MGKIKILLVLEATAGGTRRYITQVLSHIDLDRFEPVLFCAVRRDPAFLQDIESIRRRGIKVRIFPMRREISPLLDMWLTIKMAKAIRMERPDIVHTHSSKAGIIGRTAARMAGVAKIAHTPHVFPFEMDVGEGRRRFYLFLERIAARWTTLLIAVSDAERKTAIEHGLFSTDNSVIIANGIDPAMWRVPDMAERDKLRDDAGIPRNVFVAGMVGRFMPQKGHRIFVQAAEVLLDKSRDIYFAMVGDGELKDEIRKMVSSGGNGGNFHFFGQTDEIASRYAMFDCLVLPSLWEGCPFTAMEAMVMRIPVVASSVGGVGEIIEDGVSGILVPPADAASLAGAIWRLCEDRSLLGSMGEKSRQRVLDKFLLSDKIRNLEGVYQRMYEA